jgi:hypothetical protein
MDLYGLMFERIATIGNNLLRLFFSSCIDDVFTTHKQIVYKP